MDKNDFFKCIEIRKRLIAKVKGKVFIGITNGQMSVTINGFRGIKFISYLNDVPEWMTYEQIADEIFYLYKKFITETFFN